MLNYKFLYYYIYKQKQKQKETIDAMEFDKFLKQKKNVERTMNETKRTNYRTSSKLNFRTKKFFIEFFNQEKKIRNNSNPFDHNTITYTPTLTTHSLTTCAHHHIFEITKQTNRLMKIVIYRLFI